MGRCRPFEDAPTPPTWTGQRWSLFLCLLWRAESGKAIRSTGGETSKQNGGGTRKTKLAGVTLSVTKIEKVVKARLVAHQETLFARLPVVANTHLAAQLGCRRRRTEKPSWTDAELLRAPPFHASPDRQEDAGSTWISHI